MSTSQLLPSGLTIRLFGPLDVCCDGRSLPALRFRKSQWLLALLVLRHGGPVERDWLGGLLWPEGAEGQALRNSLANLRRVLGPEAARLHAPSRQTLALDLAGATVDVLAFDAALTRGDPMALEAAVALYRGPLLEGCSEEWVSEERERRAQAYLGARERLAALAQAAGQMVEAEQHLRLAVAADPLRECAQRALMQVRAAGGNYAAALLGYRELRLRLHRELNAEPDPETVALFEQLRGEARRRSMQRSGVRRGQRSEASHGSGVGDAERHRAIVTDSASPHTIDDRPNNLPVQRMPLIGREKEVDRALELLRREETGLLTLTGAGGSGKTRLGLQMAADLLPEFEHGIFFVELAPIRDPDLVGSAIAQVLGVREVAGAPLVESLKAYLKDKQLLLLLDNFEQVLVAAPLVAGLLAASPRLKVLVTSRAALQLRGEQEFAVPPLALPDPQRPPAQEAAAPTAAVELFVLCARQLNANFTLTEENTPAVATICRRLDGLPLAIELAAVRTKLLPPQALLDRLVGAGLVPAQGGRPPGSPLRLLTGGPRDLPARQQTLWAAIAWSYDLLAEPEKKLFRLLAVFAGGCTLEAAEAVCNVAGDPAIDVLEGTASLVDMSLLQQEEQASGEPRCTMLETIREFAVDLLTEQEDETAIRDRHAQFYLCVAVRAEVGLQGHEQAAWLPRLDAEADNMRAALDWLAKSGKAEPALRLAAALGRYWRLRGRFLEGRERLASLLALPGAQTGTAARAGALHATAVLAWRHGDGAAARAPLEESLGLWRELGNHRGVALCLVWLADVLDDREAAFPLAEESLRLWSKLGDKAGLAHSLHVLGKTAQIRGQLKDARPLLEEGLAIRREVGDREHISQSLWQMGTLHRAQGDPGEAERYFEECLKIAREMGGPGPMLTLIYLGELALDRGEEARARAFLEESVSVARELGNPRLVARPLLCLAKVVRAQGDYPRGEALLQEALTLLRKYGRFGHSAEMISRQIATALSDLGYVAYHQGDPGRARGLFEESLGILCETEAETEIAICIAGLAGAAYLEGRPVQAARLLGAAASQLETCDPLVYRNDKADYARVMTAVRAAMVAPEFAAAWAEGRTTSLNRAIDDALRDGE